MSVKKESIAETTLNQQIKQFKLREDAVNSRIAELKVELQTVFGLRSAMESEVSRLQRAREKASKDRQPGGKHYNAKHHGNKEVSA